jgi:hypothetical protein
MGDETKGYVCWGDGPLESDGFQVGPVGSLPNEIPGGKWVGRSDESPEAAIEDARRQAREYLERYAVCVDMELAPVLDPEVIERALCWFNGADKIDDEDCGLHRAVTLPEPIFQALTEHLKTMYHGDTGGTK